MHCQVSPLSYTNNTAKLFCLCLFLTHSLNFFIITKSISGTISVVNSAGGNFSAGIMQMTLSVAIMQVPTSAAIVQVLRFYCNYVGGTLHCHYVGGSILLQLCS